MKLSENSVIYYYYFVLILEPETELRIQAA